MIARITLLLSAFWALSNGALAGDRETLLRDLERMERGELDRAYSIYSAHKGGYLGDDLRPRALALLYRCLDRNDPYGNYLVGRTLELLGERGEKIQNAILRGMKAHFPFRQGFYRKFARTDAADLREIRNPAESTVEFIVELSRYGGNGPGAMGAMEILIEWGDSQPQVKSWLDHRNDKLIEGAVWLIEHWQKETARWEGAVKNNARKDTRLATHRRYLETALACYARMKEWWPTLSHVLPTNVALEDKGIRSNDEDSELESDLLPLLQSDDPITVTRTVNRLLDYPKLSLRALVALDSLRAGDQINEPLKNQVKGRIRTEVAPYLNGLLHEEPGRALSFQAFEAPDQVSACLSLVALSSLEK